MSDRYEKYLAAHGHECPAGYHENSHTITVGDTIVQIGTCTCGEVVARRYVVTGTGTGPWTILNAGSEVGR